MEFIVSEKFAIFEVILTQFEVTCAIGKSYGLESFVVIRYLK